MKKFWQRLVLFGLTGAFFVSCISCSAANTASKVPILMYHNLTNDPSAVTSMTITGERFQEDMEYLEYNGYTPLLSADLINIRAGKEAMPERPVMITFDDGYRSNYDIAYPILQKTGMKAVIALIGKSIRANDNTEANRFPQVGRGSRNGRQRSGGAGLSHLQPA
ncbi:MAG: polysaccharide deacetylase family protein [Butyricicoccus sp.]